jgi:hypothetical protein
MVERVDSGIASQQATALIHQSDMMFRNPGWGSADAIQAIEATRVHQAARRRGSMAANGARAAAWNIPPKNNGFRGYFLL